MKPYFEQDGITLYHGDFRELTPPATPLDACIADPPYGETSLEWDRWPDGWVSAVDRWIKPSGTMWCFGSLRMFMNQRDELSKHFRIAQEIVWEKHNGSSFHADRFKRVHELVVQFWKPGIKWDEVYKSPVFTQDATKRSVRRKIRPPHMGNIGAQEYTSIDGGPRLMRSVIPVRSCHGYAIHPTQKPIGIIDPLLRYSVPPKGSIVVPFAGSGADLEAARMAGITAVAAEADESYCEKIAIRLSQHVLFGAVTL